MDLVQQYEVLTQHLFNTPNDSVYLCELIVCYPRAKDAFDYEIADSIALYVDNLGHNREIADFLKQQINESQNQQQKNDFSELLNGLFAIKILVLTELETYQNDADIEAFFDFILALKADKNIEVGFLVDLLTQLSGEINQNNLPYTILTDTLDYMTGWYALNSIPPNISIANFIKNLKK